MKINPSIENSNGTTQIFFNSDEVVRVSKDLYAVLNASDVTVMDSMGAIFTICVEISHGAKIEKMKVIELLSNLWDKLEKFKQQQQQNQ